MTSSVASVNDSLLLGQSFLGRFESWLVPTAILKRLANTSESTEACRMMSDLCRLIWGALTGLVRSRAALQAEILVLRHQLNVLRRKSQKRLVFTGTDRLVFVALYPLAPGVLDALKILKPETVIRWHRAGSRAYWGWKSRCPCRKPKTFGERERIG